MPPICEFTAVQKHNIVIVALLYERKMKGAQI